MPTYGEEDYVAKVRRRELAEQRVAQKYPKLIYGSSGWYRAFKNQLRKRT